MAVSERGAASLVDLLRRRAEAHPEREAFVFLADGEGEEERASYGDLDRQARAIAVHLQAAGLTGERALLLYPPGLDFVRAFLACLYAGVVAVPAYPSRSRRTLPRLQAIAEDARPRAALTSRELLPKIAGLGDFLPGFQQVECLATDSLMGTSQPARSWKAPPLSGSSLAFLQYTSGSTASPKGVMVSHANLVANEELIAAAFRQSEESVIVGWLPVYHDMGLIGNVLQPLFVGARCVLMSPVAFLQQPLRWLSAIERYRGTTSGGPNFA